MMRSEVRMLLSLDWEIKGGKPSFPSILQTPTLAGLWKVADHREKCAWGKEDASWHALCFNPKRVLQMNGVKGNQWPLACAS